MLQTPVCLLFRLIEELILNHDRPEFLERRTIWQTDNVNMATDRFNMVSLKSNRYIVSIIGCALFSKFFGHNPVLIDDSELSAMIPSFSRLNNVYLCL